MTDRMLDSSIRRSANESWYVTRRASQQDRYARCLQMLVPRLPEGALVYDLGAGTGHFARLLATHARAVIGVERITERVEQCRASSAELRNLQYVNGDFLDLEIPDQTADAICALEMLYYLEPSQWGVFFDKIARTLRPGGLLLASLNVFPRGDMEAEATLLEAVGARFRIVDTQYMHRMHYYRLELPLIRLLDEITYLESVKVFYPHTFAVEHVVYSPKLDRLLMPPSIILDRFVLPGCKRVALAMLSSRTLYRAVTAVSRWLAPRTSRSQIIVLACRSAQPGTA